MSREQGWAVVMRQCWDPDPWTQFPGWRPRLKAAGLGQKPSERAELEQNFAGLSRSVP